MRTHQPDPAGTGTSDRRAAGRSTTTRAGSFRSTSPSSAPAGRTSRRASSTAQLAVVVTSYDPRGLAIRTTLPGRVASSGVVPGRPGRPGRSRRVPADAVGDATPTTTTTTPAAPAPPRSAAWSAHWNTPSSDLRRPAGHASSRTPSGPRRTALTHPQQLRHRRQPPPGHRPARPGRVPVQVYDLLRRSWRQQLIDAGTRPASSSTRPAAPSSAATASRAHASPSLDALRRPLRLWARDRAAGSPTLREAVVYGDDAAPRAGSAARPRPPPTCSAAATTPTTRPAGSETASYDLDGNLLEKTRRVLATSVLLAACPAQPATGPVRPTRPTGSPPPGRPWTSTPAPLLDATALHRQHQLRRARPGPASVTAPLDAEGHRKILQPAYSRAGALTALTVDGDTLRPADPLQRPRAARPGRPRERRR